MKISLDNELRPLFFNERKSPLTLITFYELKRKLFNQYFNELNWELDSELQLELNELINKIINEI